MTRKGRRLALIGSALGVLGLAAALVLVALRDNVVFFRTPTELAEKSMAPGARLRIGGLVEQGSLVRGAGQTVAFSVTDQVHEIKVRYTGALPDLFGEGQGVVAEGVMAGPGLFMADSVLAKHDERYMPREVADALKQKGVWQGAGGAPRAAAAQ